MKEDQNSIARMHTDSVLEDLRKKAAEKYESLKKDPNAAAKDIKTAKDILLFLANPEGFRRVPQSTVFNIFSFLKYRDTTEQYIRCYNEIMREVNKVYTYVDPRWLKGG